MARLFRIWWCFFKNVLAETMSYRLNFFLMMTIHVGWFAVYLATYGVIFSQVKDLAGWSPYEVLFLAGTWQLIFTTFVGIFVPNLSNISWFIKTGEMDFVLCKPVGSLFYLSINRVELGGLSSMVSAIPALVIAGRHLPGFAPTAWDLAAYCLLIIAGIAILYSLMLSIVSIAFWATRASAVQGLFWAIQEFGGYPAAIYSRPLRWVLTFIIPVAIIANLPASMMLKGLDGASVALMVGIAALALLAARLVFYAGLKRYQSASS